VFMGLSEGDCGRVFLTQKPALSARSLQDFLDWRQEFCGLTKSEGDPGAVYKTLSLPARQRLKPDLFDALCPYPENDL